MRKIPRPAPNKDDEFIASNEEKVFYPATGTTKGDVLRYYAGAAEVILPHLKDRPLTMLRFPDGVEGGSFYEKNAPSHTPDWVETFGVPRSDEAGEIRYILCNDRRTLLWVTNLGDIEKHVLLAQAPRLERPTAVVFDLDPVEGAGLVQCGEVALALKRTFDALKLQAFVKVSGSKGLHLTVPLNTAVTYARTQPFARAIAELLARDMPDRVVTVMAKAARRGRVLIDWSQNSESKTTVCVYALRARRAEPWVSLPVTWEEIARLVRTGNERPLQFPPEAALRRIRKWGDLFAPVLELRQKLPARFERALAPAKGRKSSQPRAGAEAPEPRPRADEKNLAAYTAKRDRTRTAEPMPKGKRAAKAKTGRAARFVVQKHAASHLHYDFRLEMEGSLRSWAVPKGPPTKLREARLAMHVEDHPLEYADFEGTIPAGNYGAGTVMVWDQGSYTDESGDPAAAFRAGKLHLTLAGEKLKGEWILVRDRREEEGNKWLLIKAGAGTRISAKADDTSVPSGRSLKKIAAAGEAPPIGRSRAVRREESRTRARSAEPRFLAPMQCRPVRELPAEPGWTFELKFDGFRCLAVKAAGEVSLFSRNENSLNDRFPGLVRAVGAIEGDFVLDGEAVALDGEGRPSFRLLQDEDAGGRTVLYYAFDLLHLEGGDLLQSPIAERRERLQALLRDAQDPIRLSDFLPGSPEEILAAVRKLRLEGVIGKRAGSVYESGRRSGAWIKLRMNQDQEFVIGGFVAGGHGFDSLLLGVFDGGKLQYVGKLRNGFEPAQRAKLLAGFAGLHSPRCPFANLPEKSATRWGTGLTAARMAECHWLKPVRVCQAGFVEWTSAGHLRHPTYLGLREDKDAREVRRET